MAERLWITEGPLKADLAADRLGAVVVAAPGAGMWRRGLEMADKLRPERGVLVVAYDMDAERKEIVRRYRDDLVCAAAQGGWDVHLAEWDIDMGKGIDDALVGGEDVSVREARFITRTIPLRRRHLLPTHSFVIGGKNG